MGMPESWSYVGGVSGGDKENLVTSMASLSIRGDEGTKKIVSGSKKPTDSKPQGAGRCSDVSPISLATGPHNSAMESLRKELLKKIDGQANDIKALRSSNAELITSNAELWKKVNTLTSSNTEFFTTVQRHTKTLNALTRRMVLDDARNKLANDYKLTLDELRPRCTDVGPLVERIRSRLNAVDSSLLSNGALAMIFDSSDNSMRDSGNKAAHAAPLSDRTDSVLEATLSHTQKNLLGEIYYFAYNKTPDFGSGAAEG